MLIRPLGRNIKGQNLIKLVLAVISTENSMFQLNDTTITVEVYLFLFIFGQSYRHALEDSGPHWAAGLG